LRSIGNNATTADLTQALKELQRAVQDLRTSGGPAISRDLDMNGFRITNLGLPKAARDAQTRTGSGTADDSIASDSASYVLINPSGGLDNHRVLAAGTGITITDGGATGDVTITGTGGTVTSVAVSGANGIGVSGSPITSSGTIALSLGNITPTTVSTGTVTSSDHYLLTTQHTGVKFYNATGGESSIITNWYDTFEWRLNYGGAGGGQVLVYDTEGLRPSGNANANLGGASDGWGALRLGYSGTYHTASFVAGALSGDITLTSPTSTGTLALTSDISALSSVYQPLDADLTSWAAITRGTGFDTAAAVNVGTDGAFVVKGGALGTPSSGVATNLTGTASGLTAGNVTTNANLTGPITSVGNATSIASQTGTGTKFVMDTSPTLVTPVIGVASGTALELRRNNATVLEIDLDDVSSAGKYGLDIEARYISGSNAAVAASIISYANSGTPATNTGLELTAYNNGATTGTAYGLYLQSFVGSGSLTNGVALHIPNITGATNNWAIQSAGGQSYHVGNLRIGSTTAPTVPLDVTGAALFSSTVGITGALSLTVPLGAANGGTGFASYTVGDLLYADTTTTLARRAAVATGQVLTSAGTGTAPAWSGTPSVTSIQQLTNNTQAFLGKPTSGSNDYSLGVNSSNNWIFRRNVGGAVGNGTLVFGGGAGNGLAFYPENSGNNSLSNGHDLGFSGTNQQWLSLYLRGTTSGTVQIKPPAAAGTGSVGTLPTGTFTFATLDGAETFTNKTLTNPTLTTPVLGTPSSGTLTSCTGLPIDSGVVGVASHYMFLATGNQAGNYDTTLFSIFPGASDAVSVSASSTYYFRAVIRISKTNGTNAHDVRFALTESGSALSECWWTAVASVNNSTIEVNSGSSSAAAKCSPNTSGTNSEIYDIVIDGYFLTAAGTTAVTPQVKWNSAPGDGATTGRMSVNVGTLFEMRRAGGVVETQGTWN